MSRKVTKFKLRKVKKQAKAASIDSDSAMKLLRYGLTEGPHTHETNMLFGPFEYWNNANDNSLPYGRKGKADTKAAKRGRVRKGRGNI